MSGQNAATGDHVPPEEPFAHMTNNPQFGPNSPVFLTLFAGAYTMAGGYVTWLGLRAATTGRWSGLGIMFIGFCWMAVGAYGTYMGVRRWQWKREYERVTGRSPW